MTIPSVVAREVGMQLQRLMTCSDASGILILPSYLLTVTPAFDFLCYTIIADNSTFYFLLGGKG